MFRHSVTVAAILLSSTFASSVAYGQQAAVPAEPQSIGVVNYLDPVNNTLKPLPRQPTQAVVHTGIVHASGSVQIPGPHSVFRLKLAETMEFVVTPASGAGPDRYKLYAFTTKKKVRAVKVADVAVWRSNQTIPRVDIHRDTSRYGDSSYKFTYKGLGPGEYAFLVHHHAFSFGIDPQ